MTAKTSLDTAKKIKWFLCAIVGLLALWVLILAGMSHDYIAASRDKGTYTVVRDVTTARNADNSTEYRFGIGRVLHAETLGFYTSHHAVQVYINDACLYSLTASDDMFDTVGGTWVMIPLYGEDAGCEVRVVLKPLYKNYRTKTPEFMIGSEIALHNATLHRALPTLGLGLCVMFVGFVLIGLAIYHSVKGIATGRLYGLGFMALSAGLWRITYDRAAYLLVEEHTVLVYTVSIISLMAVALSMLNVLGTDEKGKRMIHLCSWAYCVLYIILLLCQITGIADLRELLKVVHPTIAVSAAAFVGIGAAQWRKPKMQKNKKNSYGWILGVGVVTDLILYYIGARSFNMIFSLVAILCYSLLEGFQLLFAYVEQQNALQEMELQLRLSRAMTMMSQIRSHFVFNVLNAISGMCKYDPEMADETVIRFARYLRNNIDIMENDRNIPFAVDLRQLEDYVVLEQMRFGDKVEFYTDLETDAFMIPPLILQPIVENAIKHGISKKQGNGTIILRTRETDGRIVITVEDDGVGFDITELDKEQSVGIRNIRFRLEHLVHGTLEIQSKVGEGTIATITIPKEDAVCISSM